MNKGESRTYRNLIKQETFKAFQVVVKETDLQIYAKKDLTGQVVESVLRCRGYLEFYIKRFPDFLNTLVPWQDSGPCPQIIREMIGAGEVACVGPMAAVAGAIAECVGRDLLKDTDEIVVENGGDVFIKTHSPIIVGIYAGESVLSLRVGLCIDSSIAPVAVCTSSGTVGHSLSMGKADAVCVISGSCAIADAAATSIGNRVRNVPDIPGAIEFGKNIRGVEGIVVILGDQIGLWGNLDLIGLKGKNP